MAVCLLKAKLQQKRTLRLIITQQGLDLTMYSKILIVTQYIMYHDRVCYLARARAMARVVLAQIEFPPAICVSPLSYWNPDSYQTIVTHQNYRYTIASDHRRATDTR